jgi:hypothetical protein
VRELKCRVFGRRTEGVFSRSRPLPPPDFVHFGKTRFAVLENG